MDYEIVNVLRPDNENWTKQLARLKEKDGKLITLAPDPLFQFKSQQNYPNVLNIVDYVTERTYDPTSSLFFDKVPTVDGAEIFVNNDGTISIICDGETIAMLRTYPGTRRLVRDVKYLNSDGTTDYLEEYAFDGKLFSQIYYFENKVQQIAFYNDDQNVRLRFYFYDGSINAVTIVNPITQKVERKFDNLNQFFAEIVGEIVKPNDQVGISYMGVELNALAKTKSKNSLYLDESVFDDTNNIKGNLEAIMDNRVSSVDKVYISEEDYAKLLENKVDMHKYSVLKK
ncbi:hypothetical protein [Pediococcus claussenii]|uniref:Accessory Sec system glycosyltransferase GtfB n=1 Tax=Pediococcus claussenii (strain ATCC BAA-344 / DSM 14800 / JCM 18046 / KCTC 3811 / LMG 21948 / P06) TaxID=701521 RepID=G8PCD4_PEDCP|nr:hypothetical protein [Pediococcus claussenii]AEV94919.1 hypothetical protein PECL_623 [Pediococcus claussenii ATCC BAA-344]ANZ70115.1 hypothetical protein AYR57_07185 [Pediococcus claussenii]ANZ71930.1 hypothetical protein AYR58_07185 [Pediococcus claussenii]KRN18831.1 hypothetical protein IV79_GL000329 [Pediococcus claussenii]